ncbi:MAG: DUF6089 family protein [Bacteroidales bacterium]|jgi:hypothetical protein|nr:DUF6089 family protein [Bacteroidales bacterium]
MQNIIFALKNKEIVVSIMFLSTKRLLLCLLIILPAVHICAQTKEFNIGFFVGTSQYNGDVNMTKAYYSPHISGGIFAKQVYNYHYSARYAITYGELKGFDSDFKNLYQYHRGHSFRDNNLYEFSAVCEFNFFEVNPDRDEKNVSPYVIGGVAMFFIDDLEWYQVFNFPMGLGMKFRIATRTELSVEWVFRKTFTDRLDKMESSGLGYKNFKQYSFDNTKDWYSIASVSLSFCFLNPQSSCPVYYKKPYELRRNR